jgi:hypothetical protein
LNIPRTPTTSRDRITQGDIQDAKDVKPDVYQAQQQNDPTFINKYLRGNGYEFEKKGGMWQVVRIGPTMSEKDRVVDRINPNQAEEVYNAIAEYGKLERDAIDQFEFNPAIVGDETPMQREVRSTAEREIETLFSAGKKLDEKQVSLQDYFNLLQRKYELTDVEILDEDESKPTEIKIGEEKFDLTNKNEAERAFNLLQEKMISSKLAAPAKKSRTGLLDPN